MPSATSARPTRWAAAVPSTTGATAAGRVRGRAPATHWEREAMWGSEVLEEVGVVVGAAWPAAVLLAPALLHPLLLGAGAHRVPRGSTEEEPGDRADDGEEEDDQDPRELRQVAHVGLVGLEGVDDAVDRQREAEQGRDVA